MIDNDSSETAFPQPIGQTIESMQGMSLLDYFAGQALAGMMADHTIERCTLKGYASSSYDYAQAMIEERKRRHDSRTTEAPQ